MSIPLVQEATKDAINTSIIAIKRNIERINMLLGLVDSGSPDLSGLATKQELEDAITQVETDLAPVDEVTLDNMQSVTSNAVAKLKPTYYHSTTSAVSVSGTNIIRRITNLPKGMYFVTYGFGYVTTHAGYQHFYTSDANGTTSTSVMQLKGGWENVEVSCIVRMPNGGEIGFKGYNSSSNFEEQNNGKGLTVIRLCDV